MKRALFLGLIAITSHANATCTLLDIRNQLELCVNINKAFDYIQEQEISDFVKEKINTGSTIEIEQLKELLNQYKAIFIEKQKSCVSNGTLSTIGDVFANIQDMSEFTVKAGTTLITSIAASSALLGMLHNLAKVYPQFNTCVIKALEKIIPSAYSVYTENGVLASNPVHTRQIFEWGKKIGVATGAYALAWLSSALLVKKINHLTENRITREKNIQTIDSFLEAIAYEQGLKAAQQ